MPGPFTHIYTARRVCDFLLDPGKVTNDFIRPTDDPLTEAGNQILGLDPVKQLGPQVCGQAMKAWPKFTALGANGPDLFFFLQDYNQIEIPSDEIMLAMSLAYYLDDQKRLPDEYAGLVAILALVSQTWADIVRFIIKLEQIWQKFLKVWNDTIGPIVEAAGKAIDDLTGGLLSTLGQAFTELANDLLALAAEELLSVGDVFGWFALKMRKGFDEQAFLWSDMVHYRRTSIVPARLIEHARIMRADNDPQTKEHGDQLLAFALGWICHVGTDVVAHSFVNEQCGGPFRTHWQRHHLIENHIDASNYERTKAGSGLTPDDFCGYQDSYPGLNQSALYFAMQIPQGIDKLATNDQKQGDLRRPLPEGDDQATQEQRKELLDTDGELPLWLAETIVQVFIEVYAHAAEGGIFSKDPATGNDPLGEGDPPHPRNLLGQQFQTDIESGAVDIGKLLELLGVDNAGVALDELRKQIAPHPPFTVPEGFPLPWEVQTAYRFMLSWFKRSYVSTFDMDKPQRPTVFTPPASDVTNIARDFTGPPDFSGVNPQDDPISQVCEALAALLDWVFKTVQDIGQFIEDLLKTVASASSWPVREVIYDNIILPAWGLSENLRRVLVHMGYLMPQSEETWPNGELRKPSEIDHELITLGHTVDSAFKEALAAAWDPLGNLDDDPALTNEGVRDPLAALTPWLPIRVTKGEKPPTFSAASAGSVVEFQRPWAYPDRTNDRDSTKAGNYLEAPLTTAGPYPRETLPVQLLATDGTASNAARAKYEAAGCPADTDAYNADFISADHPSNPLGDPVVFSTYLMGQIANNPKLKSSYNLDADRGYAYLCWDWDRQNLPAGKQLKDDHGNRYQPPVIAPEGATGWSQPAAAALGTNPLDTPALRLNYPGRQCKESQPGISGTIKWAAGIETHHQPTGLFTVGAYTKNPSSGGLGGDTFTKVADGVVAAAQQTGEGFTATYDISAAPLNEDLYVNVAIVDGAFTVAAGKNLSVDPQFQGPHQLSAGHPTITGVDFTMTAIDTPH